MESSRLASSGTATQLSLGEILTRSPILGEFIKKTEQLKVLNRMVLKRLEPDLAPYCQVLSFSHNTLILGSFSSMWGHKLRFKVPDIMESLRQESRFAALKSIQVKVTPENNSSFLGLPYGHSEQYGQAGYGTFVAGNPLSAANPLPGPKLSQKTARIIQEMAQGLNFPKLQQALLRLSQRWTGS